MHSISCGIWTLQIADGPQDRHGFGHADCEEHSELSDDLTPESAEDRFFRVYVGANGRNGGQPYLAISLRNNPRGGFDPGLLLVPEAKRLFIGARDVVACYDLEAPGRLWALTDGPMSVPLFWRWARCGDYVLFSGELRFGVYTLLGDLLWDAWVEPPWEFRIADAAVELDFFGNSEKRRLSDGLMIAERRRD